MDLDIGFIGTTSLDLLISLGSSRNNFPGFRVGCEM
jgi:hypothetical protein